MSSKYNHILITGFPGAGKTTLICKIYNILKEKNLNSIGFYTEEVRNNSNSRIGFDVITLDGKTGRLARKIDLLESNEITKHQVGNYNVFIKEFENLALPTIEQKETNCIYIIDEIGKMELFSKEFSDRISQLFQQPNIKILATIPVAKGKSIPLLEKLRNDPTNHIITVNPSNRNDLPKKIMELLDV